jgi:glycosyltransferase involved in cell wall biosynthesis
MIYICMPTHNAAVTVGLVLWKVRQVFSAFSREYHMIVADDGSTDATAEVLEPYQRALPLSLIRHEHPIGYAASVEALLRDALGRSDRPKRDFAITIHADFSVSPSSLPALVRAMESGADLVVAEALESETSLARRLVRRSAPWLLRPGLNLPGVRDLLSGVCAVRLATLQNLLRDADRSLLVARGPSAWAELVARTAAVSRQISVVAVPPQQKPVEAANGSALGLALELFRWGRRLRVPAPAAEVRRAS